MKQNKFRVKFRGTRGSYPVAGKNFLKYGGNTACIEVYCGKRLIILDCGTGIINLGHDVVKNSIITEDESLKNIVILLSHIHQDHIQGLQFFRPLYDKSAKIQMFGHAPFGESLKKSIKTLLFNKTFPIGLEDIKADFKIANCSQEDVLVLSQDGKNKVYHKKDKLKLKEDDVKITSYKTSTHPKNGCLCFKIEYLNKSLVYATDKESYVGADKNFVRFARECSVLVHDSQYMYQDYANPISPRQGFGHSTFEMAYEAFNLAKAGKLFFFHYDPEYDDTKLKMLEDEFSQKDNNVYFSKEDMEILL
ncbi:MBL fold metallo-hydrolase [bacterium]|nr:MBL fold metallo-hydrolase [bacterium]